MIVFNIVLTVIFAEKEIINDVSATPAYIVGEIESMRTETEKVFKMSDGKMQLAVYNSPVHFKNEDGQWEEINNDSEIHRRTRKI